jgi:hypothetical protein
MAVVSVRVKPKMTKLSVKESLVIFVSASVSRILYLPDRQTIAIYLGQLLPTASSGTSAGSADTALHSGKDLAVSLPELLQDSPITYSDELEMGASVLSNFSVSARTSSADEAEMGITHYLAPRLSSRECSDFPHQSLRL